MNKDYIRKLAPRLLKYFEKLAIENPQSWSNHLNVAKKFAALTSQSEDTWKIAAQQLLIEARRMTDESSAMSELVFALREIATH